MSRASAPAPRLISLPPEATVAAVVPVLDEAATIGLVIAELRRAGIARVVVVDGGSSDGTAQLARDAGGVVVSEERRGYGRACCTGAGEANADIVVFLDGDGSDDPAYLPQLVDAVRSGRAVLALGARTRREPGAMLTHQLLGTRLVALLIRVLHGVRLDDVPPMRAIRSDVLASLAMREMTYGWPTEMIVKVAGLKLPIEQVHVCARIRGGGESKIAGRLGPSLMAGARMLRVAVRSS